MDFSIRELYNPDPAPTTAPPPANAIQGEDAVRTYPQTLGCGGVAENLTGALGSRLIVPLDIPEGTLRLTLSLDGGQGDADLYLSYGEVPGLKSFQFRPFVNGNQEEIRIANPRAGQWFVVVHGWRAYQNVRLRVQCARVRDEGGPQAFALGGDVELALYYELSGSGVVGRTRNRELQLELLNRRGREAFNAGRFEEALALWNQWAEEDPENPRPVSLVGDLHLRSGNLPEAVRHYRRSLEMQPGQIGLMSRLVRLLDQDADEPEEARRMLNEYSRLFPNSTGVALAQAEWLIRRYRYTEAVDIIRAVIEIDRENLNAMSLLHPLLLRQEDRYLNMRAMLRIGQLPGREGALGFAIRDNDLLTRPESWVLMDFIDYMSVSAPSSDLRKLFEDLLPRDSVTVEDFRVGRLSNNWFSSREDDWGDQGNLVLSADPSQTEAFLRLSRSDAMHNGFVEAEVEDTRGFFWIYARRGQGNMVRFGFEENGNLYLQVWLNDYLVTNESRAWSRMPGQAKLRLEVRGDGAMGYVNGQPAFASPVSIPTEMGLGWWGIAPWSAQFGTARVSVSRIAGGPLPVRIGLLPAGRLDAGDGISESMADWQGLSFRQGSTEWARVFTALAPEWYRQGDVGQIEKIVEMENLELRLLARYHRLRLLPMIRLRSYRALDLDALWQTARRDRVDGFTFVVDRMPEPEWLTRMEEKTIDTGMTLHFILLDPVNQSVNLREFSPAMGLFPGPRHARSLPLRRLDVAQYEAELLEETDTALILEGLFRRP